MGLKLIFDEEQTGLLATSVGDDYIYDLGPNLGFDLPQINVYHQENEKDKGGIAGTEHMIQDWEKRVSDYQIPMMRAALVTSNLTSVEKSVFTKMPFSDEQDNILCRAIDDRSGLLQLCANLGFTVQEATVYKNLNNDDTYRGTYTMLKDWQKKTRSSQIPILKDALKASGMSDIAQNL